MPKLGITETKRLYLPSTQDATVEADKAYVDIKQKLLLGDLTVVNEAESDIERAIILMSRLITSWNFTDENGEAIAPTVESVKKLETEDFIFLSTWIEENLADSMTGLSNDEKKRQSSTSIPVTENSPTTT